MSRYDGLIIPRSYSEYLNKTDSATLSQMLQHLTGLWSHAVSAGDQKPVTSDAVNNALTRLLPKTMVESDGTIVMQNIGQQFVNMGVSEDWNHLYLVRVIDKGDTSRRLSLIIDFQINISDVYTILTQNGIGVYATNKIGSISISNSTGQGLLFYAALLD